MNFLDNYEKRPLRKQRYEHFVLNFYLAEKMSQSSIIGSKRKNVSLTITKIKYVIKMVDLGCLIDFIFTKIQLKLSRI